MTKDQEHVIRLLTKIQKYCGKINLNTNGNVFFEYSKYSCYIMLNGEDLIHLYGDDEMKESLTSDNLYEALTLLKDCYKMNRIIDKKVI